MPVASPKPVRRFFHWTALSLAFFGGYLPLVSQMPEGWDRRLPLGADVPIGKTFYGGGVWAAGKHGTALTLVDSLGLGNSITGGGFFLETGYKGAAWDWAVQLRGAHEESGDSSFSIERGHLLRNSQGGWVFGLEKEPLVWGYGLQGGYLLGEAARPFPRVIATTPWKHVDVFGVPLGTWKAQGFIGVLENNRRIGESSQDPLRRKSMLASQGGGGIQSPFLSGFRLEAQFTDVVEFYANYINLWGGTLNGRKMTSGYGLGDYFTACFGLKDALAEGGLDPYDPNPGQAAYKNKARSASNSDVGMRIRFQSLENLTGADDARIYISRGAKAVNSYFQRFFSRPFYYLKQDISRDLTSLRHHPAEPWNRRTRYSLPSPDVPNDTVGILLKWPRFRLGVEYQDTVNPTNQGHRSFEHGLYTAGFYRYGDPLGEAMGGEAVTSTLHMQVDFTSRVKGRTWIYKGYRPFRDDPNLWMNAHPGLAPERNRFLGVQQNLEFPIPNNWNVNLTAAWQQQSAVDYVPGRTRNGFRWAMEMSTRWSR